MRYLHLLLLSFLSLLLISSVSSHVVYHPGRRYSMGGRRPAPWNRRPNRHFHSPPSYGRYNRFHHYHQPCWGYGCIVNV